MPAPISIVIPAQTPRDGLGPSLGALSEALFDGLVREVVLLDHGPGGQLEDIAEQTGARLVRASGKGKYLLHAAMKAARGDWVLYLPCGAVLPPGWTTAVHLHLHHANGQNAAFGIAGTGGFRATVATRLLGRPRPEQPLLLHRTRETPPTGAARFVLLPVAAQRVL